VRLTVNFVKKELKHPRKGTHIPDWRSK